MSHAQRWLFAAVFALVSLSSPMWSQPLVSHRTLTFSGEIATKGNISAVALSQGLMLAVDDELRGLLVGKKSANGFDFGPIVPLSLPAGSKDDGEEFDLEALAVSGNDVFAIGSHSAVRSSSDSGERTHAANRKRQLQVEARPDRDWLFRFRAQLNPAGTALASPPEAVSLRPLLQAHPILSKFAGLPGKENGIDVEALAVDGSTLVVGFRGPVLRHGFAPVLRVSGFPNVTAGDLLFLQLGGRGIRDLQKVDNGFLVLAGPVGDGDQAHQIYWWDGKDCVPGKDATPCTVKVAGEVPRVQNGRAEGILVLETTPKDYEVLVVYDGADGGAPTVVRIPR